MKRQAGNDYLWDGSGESDGFIRRLEELLGRFRHVRPALALDYRHDSAIAFSDWISQRAYARRKNSSESRY